MKYLRKLSAGLIAAAISSQAFPNVILDFEGPLPNSLVATSFWQGADVPGSAKVIDQYLSYGIVMSDAALVAGGVGHSASGTNSLAGIDGNGKVNYDAPVTFTFYQPGNLGVKGTTEYFAYRPDLGGGSQNLITISAFDLNDLLVGQATYLETGTFSTPLFISGVGQFHKVTVDQTLYDTYSGGIMLDMVEFGDISASTVPEPSSIALAVLGLLAIRTKRKIRTSA